MRHLTATLSCCINTAADLPRIEFLAAYSSSATSFFLRAALTLTVPGAECVMRLRSFFFSAFFCSLRTLLACIAKLHQCLAAARLTCVMYLHTHMCVMRSGAILNKQCFHLHNSSADSRTW